jgi:nucleoside-diphosphate-sugar epimerase
MRYLVTGGLGFLGSHLCEVLLAGGDEVVCMDNGIIGREQNVQHLLDNERFTLDYQDVCHGFDCGAVDGIYHLASPTAPAETYKHKDMTMAVNTNAVLRVIEIAAKYKAKLLFASSIKVHDKVNFGSTYIQGKILGEKFCAEAGFPKVARMGNVYGPRMAVDDSRVIPTFCRNIRDGKPLVVWGDGEQVDSFCYVSDAVRALVSFMDSQHNGVIEIGSPYPITIHALAVAAIRAVGIDVPIRMDQPGGASVMVCNNLAYSNNRTDAALKDKSRKVPDIGKATKFLGWSPTVGLGDGIRHTFEYYKSIAR